MLNSFKNKLLNNSTVYNIFQRSISKYGGTTKYFIEKYVNPIFPTSILEIGCGTANALNYLDRNIKYTGIDISQDYIDYAKSKFGSKGQFICGDLLDIDISSLGMFDLVLAIGFFHHVDNITITKYLNHLGKALEEKNSLYSIDVCFIDNQSWFSKYIVSMDRGNFIRTEQEYVDLVKLNYVKVDSLVRNNLLILPHHSCIMFCSDYYKNSTS